MERYSRDGCPCHIQIAHPNTLAIDSIIQLHIMISIYHSIFDNSSRYGATALKGPWTHWSSILCTKMIKLLIFASLVLSAMPLHEHEWNQKSLASVLIQIPFKELPEIEKEKTALEEYLQIMYKLQYIYEKQDSRHSICNTFERYYFLKLLFDFVLPNHNF